MTTAPASAPDPIRANTVDTIFRRSVRRQPTAPALEFEDRSWTYQQLDTAVDRVARHLLGLGLVAGDRVAAYGKNSDAYLFVFLACARAGFVHVPVNYALQGEELSYIVAQSGARALLADADLQPTWQGVRDGLGVEFELTLRGGDGPTLVEIATSGSAEQVAGTAADTDLLQLLYTSGTTAKPKGAMLTQQALVAEYVSCIVALDFTAGDRPLVAMPIYHSAGMHVFLLPYLSIGAHVTLLEKPDVGEILRLVEERRIGSLFLAPTVWVPLSNHPDLDTRDLSSLTKAQYGASIMPVTVLQRLRARYPGIGFYNCFGQSEIGPLATVLRPEEHDARPASCGRAVLMVELKVVDAEGKEVPPGEPGEVVYRSPQLCTGYWDNPEATADAFAGGWFHSGDQVKVDEDGYLEVVDRIKDVINTGGILVASREVEDVLYELDGVAEVAVIGTPDDRWIEAITAVVVAKPGADLTADEVTAHVKDRLAHFKVPKQVHFVDELPRNQSGKLLKRELRDRASSGTLG
jgi:fatty-acyl-CoA synthase